MNPPLISRIRLRNYKSIAACDVRLGQLAFLVGPNGSGKSNFLDALRFVTDSLRGSLDHALRDRGGIKEVRRKSSGHPTNFGIRFDFALSEKIRGHYAFAVAARPDGAYSVSHEECSVAGSDDDSESWYYRVEDGEVIKSNLASPPAASHDRLYLVNASGLSGFRSLYDAFSRMGFYNLNPVQIRDLQPPDPGDLLARDGSNLPSVLEKLEAQAPELKQRIEDYLSRVVPGIAGVDAKAIGPRETIEFRQEVRGAKHPWKFLAASMSDGTLRALGILSALFQTGADNGHTVRLVGIEEPEVALHPAAAGVITDSLRDASESKQIIVTSHSPELLDDDSIPAESVLAVLSEAGETKVGGLDEAGRSTLRDHLYTAGDLLRMDQLRPNDAARAISPNQLELFAESE